MDWSAATGWWVICGILVGLELSTGTFYLLMLALGAAAGALGAHAGLSMTAQLALAAVLGGAAVALWHRRQLQRPSTPAEANPDVNLDVGQTLDVPAWRDDGTAEVRYRGAAWQARYAGQGLPHPGRHVIRAIHGSVLLLEAA